jgi:hypothetical protein
MRPGGIAGEANNERKVYTKKIDSINKGTKTKNKPIMYFDFVFAKTLKYTAIRPIRRNILIQTTITPSVGKII